MHLSRRIVRGVKWNAFESIAYQLLLCLHRFILYKVVGGVLFGTVGSLFSCVYACIFFAQLGFNESMNAFFKEFSVSRATTRRFFLHHGVLQCILLVLYPLLVYCITLPNQILSLISHQAFYAACLLFILESIRIALRTLLQLTFINKELALIDFFGLCLYVSTVWLYWFCGYTLTVESLLFPLVGISFLQVPILSWYALRWYLALPDSNILALSHGRIIRVRFFSWLHHIASSQSIGNALIPYTAYVWGLEYASLAKLLGTISQMITTILRHTVGFSSLAFFAHLKNAPAPDKRPLLYHMNKILFSILICVSITAFIVYTLLASFFSLPTTFIILFILTLILETCFIPCEAAYLTEERADILAGAFLGTLGTFYLFSLFHVPATSSMFLFFFIGIRSIILSILIALLHHRWR